MNPHSSRVLVCCSIFGALWLWLGISSLCASGVDPASFRDPAPVFGVETWWHWLDGRVSKEGIARDFQSMEDKGIQRATLFDVGFGGKPVEGSIGFLDEAWLAHIRFAAEEAGRRGMHLGLHLCPGWSLAGGPWITPEMAMKRVVWSAMSVEGGREMTMTLPPLPAVRDWARDSFVLAWPDDAPPSRMRRARAVKDGNGEIDRSWLNDGNPFTILAAATDKGGKVWTLTFSFDEPYEADRIFLYFKNRIWKQQQLVTVRVLAGGETLGEAEYTTARLETPVTVKFRPTAAREYTLAVSVPEDAPFSAANFSLREAELLRGDEQPQWRTDFPDWSNQIVETAGPFEIADDAPATGPVVPAGAVVDLTGRFHEGRLQWTAPPGRWKVVRFGYTTTGKENQPARPGGAGLESDKMSAAATELHYRSYITPILAAASGEGKVIDLLLADSWEADLQNWTDDFPAEFRRLRGYELTPWLPVLAGATVESRPATLRFMNDFRETIADLVVENFYGRLKTLAHRDGLRLAAEFSFAGPRLDFFQMTRQLDLPMEEIWSDKKDGGLPDIPGGTIRPTLVAQAARVLDKNVLPYEMYTSFRADWRRTPGDFGFVGDVAFLKGMNQTVLHTMMHQPDERVPGLTLQGFGQHFQRHNTWWRLARDWIREISRKQYVFQSTRQVFDFLVYYGDTSPRGDVELKGFNLPENVLPLVVDRQTLLERVSVRDGRLQLDGRGDYACLVLPESRMFAGGNALEVSTLRRLAELVRAGAVLVGEPPHRTPGLLDYRTRDAELAKLAGEMWRGDVTTFGQGRVYRGKDLTAILQDPGCSAAVDSTPLEPGREPLKISRRQAGEAEGWFLFNPNAASTVFTCEVKAPAGLQPVVWDPTNGERSALAVYRHHEGRLVFPLEVAGRSSVFVFLEKAVGDAFVGAHGDQGKPFSGLEGVRFRMGDGGWQLYADRGKVLTLERAGGRTVTVRLPEPRRMALENPLRVTFVDLKDKPVLTLDRPVSWTELKEDALRNYSGVAIYETEVDVSPEFVAGAGEVALDLGEVGRVARVRVNGQDAGTLWRPPYFLSVRGLLHPGANHLRIEVANTWLNRLMADQALPEAERTTWTTWPRFKEWLAEKPVPEKSGLLAPPALVAYPLASVPD